MADETKVEKPEARPKDGKDAKDKKAEAKAADSKPADRPEARPADTGPPSLEERHLRYAEIAAHAKTYEPASLIEQLRDGRAIVRANAALALAAAGQAVLDIVPLLRDSEARVAQAAAEALGKLGGATRGLIPQIVAGLDGARAEVIDAIVGTLASMVGLCDDELIAALDVPLELAHRTVIAAAGTLGAQGVGFLVRATKHERSRIRINAVAGLGRFGKADMDASLACLAAIEAGDPVPDIRTAAKQASLLVVAREKAVAIDHLPKNIPDFEDRKLSASELREYADQIDVDEMIFALRDGRDHVRVNGCRGLAAKGAKAGRAATAIGLLMRDSVGSVRREAAKALGKLGAEAVAAAPDLVGALGDKEDDVIEAVTETLADMGERARDALVAGLETGDEAHGVRVGELITRLPGAVDTLVEAFGSPRVNTQVHAALALGLLGDKVGRGLQALHGARTGGDARTRAAVRRALDRIEGQRAAGPAQVTVDGFEQRVLAHADLEKAKADVEKLGVADLTAYLMDGRDVVRANAATALGVLGAPAAGAARALGVRLRDDAAIVRVAAARALDKLGDAAVVEVADDLVKALGDADTGVTDACTAVLRARKGKVLGALVRGLETDQRAHGKRIVELIGTFEDATDILCDAFASPAVNVQVNAALGLALLGPQRVGKGRKALEGARTGGWEPTRIAVREALEILDGPRDQGPQEIAVPGFETTWLEAAAFADPAKLRLSDLVSHLQDGRAIVRANAATGLGVLGPAASGVALPVAVLLRDDDNRVRIAAARALDKLGDDAVKSVVEYLVGALRGDAEVAAEVSKVLAARKARVLTALLKGLETDDETHAKRIVELILVLPDACEILCDAFASPAENVQVNAAMGIGMLGAKRAGSQGKKTLEGARTGGWERTREAVRKALAALAANA